MSLDHIVSLAVAIAEAPGSYSFLLGSGVSRDAGVLTGAEVFTRAVEELYRLENKSEATPPPDELNDWLSEAVRPDMRYSDVLQLIAPDPATRRDYLAKHFAAAQPGPTHEHLAELAARGLVKVFVTTNFDRLLEHALNARGIEPVVVSSDTTLEVAPRREHSACFVLKPHGDYLQETIRNTPAELADLEPGIAAELQEVFDRYGMVVLGYSGGDEAIVRAIRARRSRYGLYWVARGEVAEPGRSLVEAVAGRVVVRTDAASFLTDLDRRLAVFEAQPSGMTPVTVNKTVISLMRSRDSVGMGELLRAERQEFFERVTGLIQRRRLEQPTADIAREVHRELLPVLERRLASLLSLVLYEPDLFSTEVRSLAEIKDRLPMATGVAFWPELVGWCLWWLTYAVGAYAARTRRFAALAPLFAAQTRSRYGHTLWLAESTPGSAGGILAAAAIGNERTGRVESELYATWHSLHQDLAGLDLLHELYPELVSSDEPLRSLIEFDFVMSAVLIIRGTKAVGRWTDYEGQADEFATQLHVDAELRAGVAEAAGLTLEEFDAQAPAALRQVIPFGGFADYGAVDILETGSKR